ncbi:MAG: hypothetical protein ABL963_02240 [Longimicrobiales bacterium]
MAVLFARITSGGPAIAQELPMYSRQQIASGAVGAERGSADRPATVYDFAGPGDVEVIAALHQSPDSPEFMTLWVGRVGRFRFAQSIEGADDPAIGRLDQPRRFTYGTEVFLHVQLMISGTGGQHEDHLLRITPDGALEAVEFQDPAAWFAPQLGPGEGVWKGTMYSLQDDSLGFEFHIWNADDGNCCPTAGWVDGTLRAEPIPGDPDSGWRLVVERHTRHSPDPDAR